MGIPKLAGPVAENAGETETSSKFRDSTFVPEIPPNGWRGIFRRACADLVFEALGINGETASLDLYHMLTCGNVTGNPDTESPSVDEIKKASSHIFIGLFGGGPRFYHGALKVSNVYPICPVTIERSLVASRPEVAVGTNALTQTIMIRRNDDLIGWFPKRAADVITDFAASVNNWMEECSNNSARNDAKDEEAGRGLKAFSAIEFVMPGTSFESKISVDSRRDGQVGLVILGLAKIFNEVCFGGKQGIGFGRYIVQIGESTLTINGKSHRFLKKMEDGDYEPNMDDSEVAALVNAAREELAALKVADMEEFCRRPKPKTAAKNKASGSVSEADNAIDTGEKNK
jgi:CRISPR type IV-associated protein Csf2